MSDETFFSIDIETDGPYPSDFSMLSFACVAFSPDGTVLGKYEANLLPLEGASQNEDTMRNFWDKFPEAWEYATSNQRHASEVMPEFVEWVISIPGNKKLKTAVCMPAGFDYMFLYFYMKKFAGRSPFSFSCVDMKSYAMALRKKPYRWSSKSAWPKRWFDTSLPHTHKAIDDAVEQGLSFLKMRAEHLEGKEAVSAVKDAFWASWKPVNGDV